MKIEKNLWRTKLIRAPWCSKILDIGRKKIIDFFFLLRLHFFSLAPFCLSLAFSFYLFITFTLFSSLQVLFYSEPCIYSNLASCSDPFTYYKITMIFRWYVGRQWLLNGATGRALVPPCVSFRLLNAGDYPTLSSSPQLGKPIQVDIRRCLRPQQSWWHYPVHIWFSMKNKMK